MKQVNYKHLQRINDKNPPFKIGYEGDIADVVDHPRHQFLEVCLDVKHDKDDRFTREYIHHDNFYHCFHVSYKEDDLQGFADFITAIEDSRSSKWEFDGDEKALIGSPVGLVFREEKHLNPDGTVITFIVPAEVTSADNIRQGNFQKFDPDDVKFYIKGKRG